MEVTFGPKATSAPTGAIILHPGGDISAIVSAAPTGVTFYFEPGVYRGVSLEPKDGQSFIGAKGAILNGSEVLTNWTQSGDLWVIGGQTQQGPVHPNAEYEPGTQRPGRPETVFIDNTPLKPVDALSKVVPGTFYFDYSADKIYIADNPTGHTVEAGKLTDAFHGSATNVTVQNLVIEKYDPPVQGGAISGYRGWTIRDNEVRLNYAVGITARGSSQIVGNYVHDNGQMGLGGNGNNILVQGNELSRNGFWAGVDPLWEAGGFKFAETINLVVRGNYAHDNHGAGMWTDIDNIHTLYEDNVVIHNTINGIAHEISYDAIIRNNTLFGNGYGDTRGWGWGSEISIQDSQNVEVYGNRVDMTGGGNGIVLIQQNRGSGTFGPYTTTGNHIHDNTIVDRDGHGYIGGFADYNKSGMVNGGNIWSNNQYFMSDGGDRFNWIGSKTFLQFKNATGETGSISQSYPDTGGWLTDHLNGSAGDDFLDGGAGADIMAGGLGNDTYYVDNARDQVIEEVGEGSDTVYASVSWATGAGDEIEAIRAYGAGATAGVTLIGNAFNNSLTGGAGHDTLEGGQGIDHSVGGAGADTLRGQDGNDTIYGGTGKDAIGGGYGDDILHGETGNDRINGRAGNDALDGGSEADHLEGGDGLDLLIGGRGADLLVGGDGRDTLGYGEVLHSTSRHYDKVVGYNANAEFFDLPVSVTGIDPRITSGKLSDTHFNADLAAAVNAATLLAHHAVVFRPDEGAHSGEMFLVVDANGTAGYQASADFVFRLDNPSNLGSLSTARFV